MQKLSLNTLPPSTRKVMKWVGGVLLAFMLLIALAVLIFDWNWLRGPIMRYTTEQTGRVLMISGDFKVKLGWPDARLSAASVSFANPSWAKAAQMMTVENIDARLSLAQLLRRKLVFPEVRLARAVVSLEKSADGRKNWLLDRKQQDEEARASIGTLSLSDGRLNYDEPAEKTHLEAQVSTRKAPVGSAEEGLDFSVKGTFRGNALNARGSGGPALSLREDRVPYPLIVDGTIGQTNVHAAGRVTSLTRLTAIDMQLKLRGKSLAQLYPLIGVTLPETPPYTTQGHLIREGKQWRYEKFSAHIGQSDMGGSIHVDTAGARPFLQGEIAFKQLNIADLGPVIGAKPDKAEPADTALTAKRVLPEIPFRTERWNKIDADVRINAKTIIRDKSLPLDNLVMHLRLKDAVLSLDPLNFGVAGGQLASSVKLDGRQDPIQAHIKADARKLRLNQLFPTFELNKASIGQVNGAIDLEGKGNSVGRMLGNANGRVALVVADGEISKFMMEAVGLHLWEMLQLKISGDKPVQIHCAIASMDVKQGVMRPDVMLLDTEVSRINVTGDINLAQETLDLTLISKTKKTSLISLRPPIYIRGTLGQPVVSIDKARLAARGLGAAALAAVNPFLLLIPLVETGPGPKSECARLIKEAQASMH